MMNEEGAESLASFGVRPAAGLPFIIHHSAFSIPESPMPTPITLPQLSDTMTEGTVVRWLKKEGDKIKANETVAEVETDKAVMEMESFDAGTLAVITVKEGEKVPVGGPIGYLAVGKEAPADVKQQILTAGVPQAA